jgi:hypothetical protein
MGTGTEADILTLIMRHIPRRELRRNDGAVFLRAVFGVADRTSSLGIGTIEALNMG